MIAVPGSVLRKNPQQPPLTASARIAGSSCAVMKITGVASPSAVRRCWSSTPDMPPSCTSTRRQPNTWCVISARKLGGRVYADLSGNRSTMQLHGALVNAEADRDLLVHLSAHDLVQHFAFARRQGRESPAQLLEPRTRRVLSRITFERASDRRKQNVLRCILLQQIDGGRPHGTHSARNVAVAGEKHHRHFRADSGQRRLQLQAGNSGSLTRSSPCAA